MGLSLRELAVPTLEAVQRLLAEWRVRLEGTLAAPYLTPRGCYLQNVALASGTTTINHGCAAPPAGWLVLRVRGSTAAPLVETKSDARTLTLRTTAACTVDLWVWP
jgi:hypothetical protein